jgi:hypothetical protein
LASPKRIDGQLCIRALNSGSMTCVLMVGGNLPQDICDRQAERDLRSKPNAGKTLLDWSDGGIVLKNLGVVQPHQILSEARIA